MQNLKHEIVRMFIDKMKNLERTRDEDSILRFMEDHHHFREVLVAAAEDWSCIHNLRARLSETKSLTSNETTLIDVFEYLLLAEGIICNLLNFVSYALVMTGHDLYCFQKRKYMKENMEEIRKVEMYTKMQFLKHHGFGALTKEYDTTFRNDIAHHNYKVDEDGVLRVRGKPIDLSQKTKPLMRIVEFINETYDVINEKLEIFKSTRAL